MYVIFVIDTDVCYICHGYRCMLYLSWIPMYVIFVMDTDVCYILPSGLGLGIYSGHWYYFQLQFSATDNSTKIP